VEDEKTDRRPVIAAVVSSPRVFLSPRGSRELILAGILGPLPIGKPDLISCVRAGLLRVPFPWVLCDPGSLIGGPWILVPPFGHANRIFFFQASVTPGMINRPNFTSNSWRRYNLPHKLAEFHI
jgi:hypothetical protein